MSNAVPVHQGSSHRLVMRCVGGNDLLSPSAPDQVRAESGTFAGREAVMSKDWTTSSTSRIARRALNPRFAEPDPERRVALLDDYKTFLAEYSDALAL